MLLRQERDPQGFMRDARRGNPYDIARRRERRRRTLWQLAQLAFSVLCMTAVLLVVTHRQAQAMRIGKVLEIEPDTGPPQTGDSSTHCYWIKLCVPYAPGGWICSYQRVCM